MKRYDLTVVMPVYNEAEAIGGVLNKWKQMLDTLRIRYRICAYNDGSKDNTGVILERITSECNGEILGITKTNSGHGPTILQGYREAVKESEWVFQIDSDDEMGPEAFPQLWAQRDNYDFLVGQRDGRKQPLPRKVISFVSRLCVRLFYGKGIWDVNTPYRLMRAAVFERFYNAIPEDTFAPNVILSGLAARHHLRMLEIPVPQHDRTTGEVSIKKWKLLKAAAKSFMQTILFAFGSISTSAGSNINYYLNRCLIGIAILGTILLMPATHRLLLLPFASLFLLFLFFINNAMSKVIDNYLVTHPWRTFWVIILCGGLLRYLFVFVYPTTLYNQNVDFTILWGHACSLANGEWGISKSWTTVCTYSLIAKLINSTKIAAFCGTLIIQILTFLFAFLLMRKWSSIYNALLFVALLTFSPMIISHTPNTATEHTLLCMTFAAFYFTVRIYDSLKLHHTIGWATLAGLSLWLATWSRGEGVILWCLIPMILLISWICKKMKAKKCVLGLVSLMSIFILGTYSAFIINDKTSGTKTIFCSDDNLWPQLFGANLQYNGTWNPYDKPLIWERYKKDHPENTWQLMEGDYLIPEQLYAKCPIELVPYVKAEIKERWSTMTPVQMLTLLVRKAQTVWWSDNNYAAINIINKPGVYLERMLFSGYAITIICGTFIFFVILFLTKRIPTHITLWMPLIYLGGNVVLLCLTEASPRYGYMLLPLLGIYFALLFPSKAR